MQSTKDSLDTHVGAELLHMSDCAELLRTLLRDINGELRKDKEYIPKNPETR